MNGINKRKCESDDYLDNSLKRLRLSTDGNKNSSTGRLLHREIAMQIRDRGEDSFGLTPVELRQLYERHEVLHVAASNDYIDAVRACISRGVDVDRIWYGETALSNASGTGHYQIVELLLDHGADVNCCIHYQKSALYSAVTNDRIDVAKLLLARGANILYRTRHAQTVLHIPYFDEALECTKLILEFADETLDAQVKLDFVNAQDCNGDTALSHAVHCDCPKYASLLINHGADASIRNSYGMTAIHNAIVRTNPDLLRLLLSSMTSEAVVTCLSLQIANKFGNTALHLASKTANSDCISVLLDYGADISCKNSKDQTPYDICYEYACDSEDKQKCIELLSRGGWSTKSARPRKAM